MKNLIALGMLVFTGCTVVAPGERGVRLNFGKVSEKEQSPGLYLWIPIAYGMATLNVQVQKTDIQSVAASRDMQDIHATIAVNWSLSPELVVNTYRNIGDEYDIETRILTPAVNEVMKATASQLTAEEVLTKRMQMKKSIDEGLEKRLANYGIKLADVSIVDLKFSEMFTQAIEQKQIAEQKAKQAEYDALKATQEAKAQVELAKGQAESQKLLRSSLTSEILQQQAISKWDGHFPQVLGSGTLPFINVPMNQEK